LIRALGVLIAGGGLSLLGHGLFVLAYIASAIAFSGSTGTRLTEFFEGLAPLGQGLALALVFGWAVALVNAVVAARGWWFKTIALTAVLGGFVAIADPPIAGRLISVPMEIGAYLPSRLGRAGAREDASSEAQVLAYVAANPTVMSAAGGTPKVSLESRRMTRFSSTVEYDVAVDGEQTVFAIVRVERGWGRSKFVLACITPLSLGYRDAAKDSCAGRPSKSSASSP
jgi:hypothetical protein